MAGRLGYLLSRCRNNEATGDWRRLLLNHLQIFYFFFVFGFEF
jgi:hypothetical protein